MISADACNGFFSVGRRTGLKKRSENFSRKRTNRNVLVEIQLVTVKTITITAFLGIFFL